MPQLRAVCSQKVRWLVKLAFYCVLLLLMLAGVCYGEGGQRGEAVQQEVSHPCCSGTFTVSSACQRLQFYITVLYCICIAVPRKLLDSRNL